MAKAVEQHEGLPSPTDQTDEPVAPGFQAQTFASALPEYTNNEVKQMNDQPASPPARPPATHGVQHHARANPACCSYGKGDISDHGGSDVA